MKVYIGVSVYELGTLYASWSASGRWGESTARFAELDSGADADTSGHRDDFAPMPLWPGAALRGISGATVSGKPIAHRGWLKKKSLGISSGVYFSSLGR